MGYGIMHMQQIDIIIYYNINHGARQGCFIRRIIEQRIGGHPYLMIKNVGIELAQPDRLLVRNKMDLVSFVGQSLS
jgi:hypothetical protein